MKIYAFVCHIFLTNKRKNRLPGFQAAKVSCHLVQGRTSKPSSELHKTQMQLPKREKGIKPSK